MFHQHHLPPYTNPTPPQPQPLNQPSIPVQPRLDLSRVPIQQQAAAYEYDNFVGRLTFNSKDLINTLTRVAGENTHNAAGIVAVIEQRILHAHPTMKLPLLYLLDSIVKNISGDFVTAFRPNLFITFTTAYAHTTQQVHSSMHRLLNTWPPVFGHEVVAAMRRRIADFDAAQSGQPQPYQVHPLSQVHHPQGLQMPPGLAMSHGLLHNNQVTPQQQPQSHYPANAYNTHKSSGISSASGSTMSGGMMNGVPNVGGGTMLRSAPVPRREGSINQVQMSMNDVCRKASLGIAPSNHQLFTINSMISSLLMTAHSPTREMLIGFQNQLRDISTRLGGRAANGAQPQHPQHQMAMHPQSNNIAPTSTGVAYRVSQALTSSALTNIMSKLPPDFLKPSQSVATPLSQPNDSYSGIPILRKSDPHEPQRASAPKALKFADLKQMTHHAAVRALYAEMPFLSKSDGMRFKDRESLREHLDWLFQKNRSKRAREHGTAAGSLSRCWYDRVDKVIGTEKDEDGSGSGQAHSASGTTTNNDKKGDKRTNAIVSTGAGEKCGACHEEFESFWSDEDQAWMLEDALRAEDGIAYHKTCVETVPADGESSDAGTDAADTETYAKDEENVPPSCVPKLEKQETVPGIKTGGSEPNSAGKHDLTTDTAGKSESELLPKDEPLVKAKEESVPAEQVEIRNETSSNGHLSHKYAEASDGTANLKESDVLSKKRSRDDVNDTAKLSANIDDDGSAPAQKKAKKEQSDV